VRRPLSKAVNVIDLGTGRPTNYTAYILAFLGARPRTTFSLFDWAWSDRHQRLCINTIPSTIPQISQKHALRRSSFSRPYFLAGIYTAMAGLELTFATGQGLEAGFVNGLTVLRSFSPYFTYPAVTGSLTSFPLSGLEPPSPIVSDFS
jgi:hypothetical protein